jgi:hypothetical protein
MPSIEFYAAQPREARLRRLAATPDELADLVRAVDPALLARRPGPDAWAPVEVVGHLRDSEEWFGVRCGLALVIDEPPFPRNSPDRWAIERQYLRQDAAAAVDAFRRFRVDAVGMFRRLADAEWERGGVHLDGRGRRTIDEFLTVMAWHDDNHLDQLRRALDGRP